MNTERVMIDLETVGTGANAAIAAIGAQRFGATRLLGKGFYRRVNIDSAVKLGLTADTETLLWWLRQDERVARELFIGPRSELATVLRELAFWLGSFGKLVTEAEVWGNGAGFDLPILASAYRAAGLTVPWKFYNERCYRTLKNLIGGEPIVRRPRTHHHALADARAQARHAIKLLRKAK